MNECLHSTIAAQTLEMKTPQKDGNQNRVDIVRKKMTPA